MTELEDVRGRNCGAGIGNNFSQVDFRLRMNGLLTKCNFKERPRI
jgi:hypothetical protein